MGDAEFLPSTVVLSRSKKVEKQMILMPCVFLHRDPSTIHPKSMFQHSGARFRVAHPGGPKWLQRVQFYGTRKLEHGFRLTSARIRYTLLPPPIQ